MIQVSLNGSRTAADGAAVPMSPEALVEAALEAVAAGADEVLVHPRTPCGRESLSPRVVGPLLRALRAAGVDVPLAVCASIAPEPDPAARIARVRAWEVLPDRAAVHFDEPGATELAEALLSRGVAVDAVFAAGAGADAGARWVRARGLDRRRTRLVVEVPSAAQELLRTIGPGPGQEVLLFGRGDAGWAAVALARSSGFGVRLGVGDATRMPDGRPAPSAALVTRATHHLAPHRPPAPARPPGRWRPAASRQG
ncbi:3-keto-5-aminohexanoate cleavage protein [Streptomyces antimicrobicus]|uniref:3-keto-5-aminohexanoate cleavage protein n=1 Tax=Streptomyces antimicrobicus TaxID=2883108 RepID=A0ABS8BDU9_9ACTN|nr:3-keto-5-aminohexanoate cleavage protein [Streptomyces antimicrobicus]MCB5182785.1 3-keto-5-aminohexanoate cleavage protein [Streptomyces antimicrobicus]